MTNKEKLLKIGKMYMEAAENGNGFMLKTVHAGWEDTNGFPNMNSTVLDAWKAAPKSKVVDLKWAIKSKVDMEFYCAMQNVKHIGKLTGIQKGHAGYKISDKSYYTRCEFRLNNWILHEGTHTVPPEGLLLKVKRIDKITIKGKSMSFDWVIYEQPSDIIAYQIIGLEGGWQYPWE